MMTAIPESAVPPALQLNGVGLDIGGARILHEVSLAVAPREMVGVIGPNGAGKTTLFNVISGIVSPTAGRVLLSGNDITARRVSGRARAGLGRTFQSSNVFNESTVHENVRLAVQAHAGGGLSLIHFPRSADSAAAATDDCLATVELSSRSRVRAGSLSHGDKRKLEIAMLLAGEPAVVLLDEPLAGVASGDVAGLAAIIHNLHASGKTVLMVEHHLEVLLDLVDRVAVMHHGELLAYGTPAEVTANPLVQSAYLGDAL